jgi:hypothetical protein
MGLLTLFVNMKVPDHSSMQVLRMVSFDTLLNGEYKDFGGSWYITVGTAICFTIFIQVLSATLFPVVWALVMVPLFRRVSLRNAVTESTVSDLYTLPEWNLSSRLAESMSIVLCIMMYSGGMPLLNGAGFIYCVVAYWSDKWCLLRASRTPPQYDEKVILVGMQLMFPAAALHAVFTCYVFGDQMLFPSDWRTAFGWRSLVLGLLGMDMDTYYAYKEVYSNDPDSMEAFKDYSWIRSADIARKATYLLLLIFLIGTVYCILLALYEFFLKPLIAPLWFILRDTWSRCCGRRKAYSDTDVDEVDFDSMVAESKKFGRIHNYTMGDNPWYRKASEAIERAQGWDDISGVADKL